MKRAIICEKERNLNEEVFFGKKDGSGGKIGSTTKPCRWTGWLVCNSFTPVARWETDRSPPEVCRPVSLEYAVQWQRRDPTSNQVEGEGAL